MTSQWSQFYQSMFLNAWNCDETIPIMDNIQQIADAVQKGL